MYAISTHSFLGECTVEWVRQLDQCAVLKWVMALDQEAYLVIWPWHKDT